MKAKLNVAAGECSLNPLVGHVCDGGWTTVKCCNLCGMPMPGESWSIPAIDRAKKLLAEWEYERVRWNTQTHSALMGYEDRQRAKAYGSVYERCKQQLESILPNVASDLSRPTGDSTSTQDATGRD
jgi:hypothetical protein